MSSAAGSAPKESGRIAPPPLYYLSTTATLKNGNHANAVWHGFLAHESAPGEVMPAIVKALECEVGLAVELACALAGRALQLPVPAPGLVLAERAMLPGLPARFKGSTLLLIASHYQHPDALMTEVLANNPDAEEVIWSRMCSTPTGTAGAVWDELVANADRHCENVLYDGASWWLFDHDLALPTAKEYVLTHLQQAARLSAIAFTATANQLAHEMLERRPKDHGLIDLSARLRGRDKALVAIAHYAAAWHHSDPKIHRVLELTGKVLGLIHLRLPALAQHVAARCNTTPDTPLLWSSPTPPAS